MAQQFMTSKEFADKLRISRRKLWCLINDGIVHPLTLGGKKSYRFTEENVNEALGIEKQ